MPQFVHSVGTGAVAEERPGGVVPVRCEGPFVPSLRPYRRWEGDGATWLSYRRSQGYLLEALEAVEAPVTALLQHPQVARPAGETEAGGARALAREETRRAGAEEESEVVHGLGADRLK